MQDYKIGQIGNSVNGAAVHNFKLWSNDNILEYDVLLVDVKDFNNQMDDRLRWVSTLEKKAELETELSAKLANFSRYFTHSGSIIVFLNKDIYELQKDYNNTFKGNELLRFVSLIGLIGLDTDKFLLKPFNGNGFSSINAIESIESFFNFNYEFKFVKYDGEPLLKPRKGNDILAVKVKIGNGNVYFLPAYTNTFLIENNDSLETLNQGIKKFLANPQEKKGIVNYVKKPEWANLQLLPGETAVIQEREKLEIELAGIQEKISTNKVKLDGFENLKRMLFTGDQELEDLVQDVFREIGYEVVVPDGNQEDLIIEEEDFIAVFEVKGQNKSGSTKNSMQVEKWVSNFGLANTKNKTAKGVLIINAFKDTPVQKRIENPFPADMLTFSSKRDHCLMLTIDLVNIMIDFRSERISKVEISKLILETIGPINYVSKV